MDSEGTDVFDLSDFDFMLVCTKIVGEKIRYTPTSQPFGEESNQLPPLP